MIHGTFAHGIGGEFGASPADMKAFQDYTFRYLAAEAGRVGLVVHIKTGMSRDATGIVGFGNPILLGSAMADPRLQKTKWLLVHGGFPFDKEIGPLLLRPNVYADVSVQDLVRSPTELGESLRRWFELAPERVCFATDAASQRHVSRQFQNNLVTKEYLALVRGAPKEDEGEIDGPLGRHPTSPLRMAVVRHGGRIFERSHVEDYEEKDKIRIQIRDGGALTASAMVVATNAPIVSIMRFPVRQFAYRSYAISLAAREGSIPKALFWDTADPYHYVRIHGGLLIVGGEDHKTGQPGHENGRSEPALP